MKIENAEAYASALLTGDDFKKLAYVRKQRLDAYGCLVEASQNLE